MVDDDFMRIVDQLFAGMMSDMLGMNPWESIDVESNEDSQGSGERTLDSDEKDAEMIDLGDSILIVVDNMPEAPKIQALIKNQHLTIGVKIGHERKIGFDLPYRVSAKRSGFSVNNGVMEMRLPKILNEESDIDSEGIVSPKRGETK